MATGKLVATLRRKPSGRLRLSWRHVPRLGMQGHRLLDFVAQGRPGHQFHPEGSRTFLGHREQHHVFPLGPLGVGKTLIEPVPHQDPATP